MESVSSKCPGWSFLPEELQEKILGLIPFEYVCTCRRVCRPWNDIFSSTKFIATQWAESPPNRNPWLVLIPFEERLSDVVINSLICEGSAAGLSLARIVMVYSKFSISSRANTRYDIGMIPDRGMIFFNPKLFSRVVCNPLTQKFYYLPAMSSIQTIMAIGITAWEKNTHKVMAVGKSGQNNETQIVEIYDSLEKSWRIVGHLPRNFQAIYLHNIVFSEGFFYCMTKDTAEHKHIMGFSIRDGTFVFAPLPDVTDAEIWPSLIACGSRILVAALIRNFAANIRIEKVIIWELEQVITRMPPSISWKEITRMPPSICEDLSKKVMPRLLVTGVGDYVCFKVKTDVIVYSLREESWICLPPCPFEYSFGSVSAFDLRPDMKTI
eukprot:PITA_12181